jgi:hypothetical protein
VIAGALIFVAAPRARAAEDEISTKPAAAAPPTRVGLADVGGGPAAHDALAALRARLEPRADLTLPKETARAALEAPLPEGAASAELDAGPRLRARELVRAAKDAYSRFEYDVALERLRQAELAVATAAPAPELTALLVDVNLLAGVVAVDRNDTPRALEAFRAAQRLDPTRRALDPGSYRPKAVALYAQAVVAEGKAEKKTSRLAITSDPAGAELWIDGVRAGTTPLTTSLVAGLHYVSAVAPGHTPRLERPLLRAGEDTRVALLLGGLPPEGRVRETRASLAASDGAPPWVGGAAAIAAAASLDVLVLVRGASPGGAEAAVYDARRGALGAWTKAAPVEPVLAALALALVPPAAGEALVGDAGPHAPSRAASAPWYRTWWVVPPLLGVGAAVALGTLWMIDRERTTTYAVNRYCFDRTCAP